MSKPEFIYSPFKSGGRLAGRAQASLSDPATVKAPKKTADEVAPSDQGTRAQSVEPAQITTDALLCKLAAKLPKAEADKLKKFISRLERERVTNRSRQKAFRDRKRQESGA